MRRFLLLPAFVVLPLAACGDTQDSTRVPEGGLSSGGVPGAGGRGTGGKFETDPRCPQETMTAPAECRATWEEAEKAYPLTCVPGPLTPGGCQTASPWCGHRAISYTFGTSRGGILCAYDPGTGALAGIVYSSKGTLTCRAHAPGFPPRNYFEDLCRPDVDGGSGGAGGGSAGGAGGMSGGAGGAGTGGAGGNGGIVDSGRPDADTVRDAAPEAGSAPDASSDGG